MPDEVGLPVSVGLAVGFAFVALFSILSLQTHNYIGREISTVIIPEGASSETNPPFLVPETIKVKIGVNNTVRWVSQDSVPHALTTDDDYTDPYSGRFDTRERTPENGGAFIMPGGYFEFTFTKAGEHSYHGEPHPWMQGTVIVLPP